MIGLGIGLELVWPQANKCMLNVVCGLTRVGSQANS